ncbi:hypothetical protein F2Q68_00040008 [Brassica cretica]|uniref:Uncharacterized protein n=1 Tax=Brassica cretica TaxID=69181 RepID=A0A8S9MEG3_BRACR|nr:hypothetical protein F2Q68_00040008 [Brassica cretica]
MRWYPGLVLTDWIGMSLALRISSSSPEYNIFNSPLVTFEVGSLANKRLETIFAITLRVGFLILDWYAFRDVNVPFAMRSLLGSKMVISKSTAMIISYSRISRKTFTERKLAGELNHHVGQIAGELNRRVVILARRAEPSCGCARWRVRPSRESARPASSN